MSDVSNANPPPAAAPSAASPANEVVIDQSPVTPPSPVGSQAPDKPVSDVKGSEHRPPSRRESIQKAFDKANADAAKPAAKETARQAPKKQAAERPQTEEQGKLDLKKPPGQQSERYREGGRFAKAPAEAAPGDRPAAGTQPPGTAAKPAAPLPDDAPYKEPPGRWADHAKAEWSAAPESVRGEVYRMAKEFDGAYTKLRGDHDTMNSIRHFHEMATQHGTTLDRALTNYVGMEQKLRQDVVGGLDVIVNNLNLRTSDGQKLTLRDVAHHILTQSPDQHKLVQAQNATSAQSHQIGQLSQMVQSLAQNMQEIHHRQQFTSTRSAVDTFADSHPGFDALGDLIEQELRFGFSLEEAYQRAAKLRPSSTHAAQTGNPTAQTRSDKSISGAPDSGPSNGSQPPRRKGDKPPSRRDSIQRAIQRVQGGV